MWKIKQKNNQPGKITKGGTSGFLISLVIHAILFFLAGLLIVFTVQKKKKKKSLFHLHRLTDQKNAIKKT